MKVLYLATNPEAEYYEVALFLKQGHEVFSLGGHLLPADLPEPRKVKEYKASEEVTEKFWELHPNYMPGKLIQLRKEFLKEFDLLITSDYPEHLTLNYKAALLLSKKLIWVWRKPPKSKPNHSRTVINLKGKGLRTVELPSKGRYNVEGCKKVWLEALSRL